MVLTKKQKADREALAEKFRHHQNEALKYRREIEMIDKKGKDKELKQILGKCFLQRSEKGSRRNNGYVRVEGFRKDYTPLGTQINMYGNGKGRMMSIEFNHHLFRDWIDNGRRISHAQFNKYLREAKAMIKLKK